MRIRCVNTERRVRGKCSHLVAGAMAGAAETAEVAEVMAAALGKVRNSHQDGYNYPGMSWCEPIASSMTKDGVARCAVLS